MARPQQRRTNWFAIWISAAVVVVLIAVGGVVVWVNNASNSPGTAPQASNVNADTGAIAVGSGPDTIDTYIDFMCPVCNSFEQTFGPSIEGWVNDGSITLNIHPISALNRYSSGTAYSTRAANAMYCVATTTPEATMPFMQAMFAQQPAENSSGLTDDQIAQIASGAGAPNAASCIAEQTYGKYVDTVTKKTPIQPGQSGIATPTVALNGTVIANSTLPASNPAALLTMLRGS